MKKLIFAMLLLCSGLCTSAQTTWSLRAGAGIGSVINSYDDLDMSWATVVNVNSNISLKRGSGWIFSPGLTVNMADNNYGVYVPLQFGYKVKMGERSLFIPKVGFAGGHMSKTQAIAGPCGELGFEIKHFTVGLDFYYSVVTNHSNNDFGFHFLLGYKF